MIELLNQPEVIDFIRSHLGEDVHTLALQRSKFTDLPYLECLKQLECLPKVKEKLPQWHENPQLFYPGVKAVEQSSSCTTAIFKSSLVQGNSWLDLTAGLGVDSFYMSRDFQQRVLVEPDQRVAEFLKHNMKVLGFDVEIVAQTAAEFRSRDAWDFDWVYLDPDRRLKGERGWLWEEMTPDVLKLIPGIRRNFMIKLSPMMDLTAIIEAIPDISSLEIVAVKNEVKEVLAVRNLNMDSNDIQLNTINFLGDEPQKFSCNWSEKKGSVELKDPDQWLYEPNAAIVKSGAQDRLAHNLGLGKLHPQTHLYTSGFLNPEFPGRILKVMGVQTLHEFETENKREYLHVISKNFPERSEQLLKRLKSKPGGDHFLYAVTLKDQQKRVILTEEFK